MSAFADFGARVRVTMARFVKQAPGCEHMNFDNVWSRIQHHAGEQFSTVTGRSFTYGIQGEVLRVAGINRNLPRSQFERAYEMLPVDGPGALQELQGPSYLFAILTDARIN